MTDKKAFTLMELIVGMVFLGIAVVTALQFLGYCQKFALMSDLRMRAAAFAQETIEAIYMNNYSALAAPPLTLPTGGEYGILRDNYAGSRTCPINIVDADGDGIEDYKKIDITVQWTQ